MCPHQVACASCLERNVSCDLWKTMKKPRWDFCPMAMCNVLRSRSILQRDLFSAPTGLLQLIRCERAQLNSMLIKNIQKPSNQKPIPSGGSQCALTKLPVRAAWNAMWVVTCEKPWKSQGEMASSKQTPHSMSAFGSLKVFVPKVTGKKS